MDMAVDIIIGAASLRSLVQRVADLINPIIGIFMGGIDFAGLSATVGEAELICGNFIMAIINFLVIAFLVFKLVRSLNKMKEAEEAAPAPASACPTQEELLADILAALKK